MQNCALSVDLSFSSTYFTPRQFSCQVTRYNSAFPSHPPLPPLHMATLPCTPSTSSLRAPLASSYPTTVLLSACGRSALNTTHFSGMRLPLTVQLPLPQHWAQSVFFKCENAGVGSCFVSSYLH